MSATAKKSADKKGFKRICADCGAKFYDLNKRPIVCPSCGSEFTGELKLKSRRGKVAEAAESQVAKKAAVVEDELEEEDTGVEEVSLDDVATAEEDQGDAEDDATDLGEDTLDDDIDGADDITVLDNDDDDDDDIGVDVTIDED